MSHGPRSRFIIIIILPALILSETRFSGVPTRSLTEAQLKEIADLRAELEKGFDEDEEKSAKERGVIVQPSWTQNTKDLPKTNTKVVVTNKELKEAQVLRDEITKAVKQDRYTPIVSQSHVGADTKIVQELQKKYENNANNRKNVTVSTALDTEEATSSPKEGPNVIEISSDSLEPDIDIRKLQRMELNKRRTREVLVLEAIEEDFSFNLGEHVQEWEHIWHGGQEYFIGRLEKDLQIVHKNSAQYESGSVLHIGSPITYLETYSFWNPKFQQQEGIILVATGNKVLWYRGNEEKPEIDLYWDWVIGNTITGLTHFTAEGQDFLVISTNQSSRAGYYALNIYQYDLENREFWIAQRLQLTHPCGETTFLNTGRDFILAVPQNNTANVYTFNPNIEASGHIHFQLKYTFDSEGIQYINSFQMGGRSYLALGGMKPQILLYQQGKFLPKTIFGNNFGLVQFFFPIPVRTYRDDLILLVQHRVDFGTHSLTVLETLIWDGEAFEATIPAPCHMGPHTVYGVNCMLDIQRDAGLKGAALLRRGDEISVIVPRHEAESGLFRLHTKLLAKNSEIMDLQEIFQFLKDWVAEQDELINQAENFLKGHEDSAPDFSNLDVLKTPELHFGGAIEEIFVNDYKWTNRDALTNLNYVLNEIEQLGDELGVNERHRRDVSSQFDGHVGVFESLDFDDVEAEILELENLNDKEFYIKNGNLDFPGILNLVELEVLEKEHIREGRQALVEEVKINEDLEFEEINGLSWLDIMENIVFKDQPLELKNLEVKGEIIVEDQVTVDHLNSLKFPESFLWSEGSNNPIIKAEKTFTGVLAANHVDTEGLINGKDPMDIITLSDAQDWAGLPTFSQLEVSEYFELNGTARGRDVEDFPINPTLEETNFILGDCEFVNLKVLGPIKVEDSFNNESLKDILLDIIQREKDPSTEILIPSEKIFDSIQFPVDFHVKDNSVNNINVDQFVPRHTTQELNLSLIEGSVYFKNLTITGTYDGVNIEDLLSKAIRIDEPQILKNTQLNFAHILQGQSINVAKTLNKVPVDTGFQTLQEDLKLPGAQFVKLKVKNADIFTDIKGNGKLNGMKLDEVLGEGIDSLARNIFINDLVLNEGLEVEEIQGLPVEFLYQFLSEVDALPEMILDGKVRVDHVSVSGEVQINNLNGQNFDEDIQMTSIWLNRPNYLSTNLVFTDLVDIQTDLIVIGDYNGNNLPDLLDDFVFRNPNSTMLILAPKYFQENIEVLGNTQVDAINGIPFNKIANKKSLSQLKGSLEIDGNLSVQELILNGFLNDFPVLNLSRSLSYDETLKAFILLGPTKFESQMSLKDLTVYGHFNGSENLKDFFDSLVYKKGNFLLEGQYNFTGRVSINSGAYISNLNGYNLLHLFDNIARIDEAEPLTIEGAVSFVSPVKARTVNIEGSLTTTNLDGCSIKDWQEDSLRLDKPEVITKTLRFAPDSLHGNSFHASFLNDIDLSKIITLNTPQNLSGSLNFSEVHLDGSINVQGPINKVDLQMEYENTVMLHGDQRINAPLTLREVIVINNLQTLSPINDNQDLRQVALLHEDTEFESPFFFGHIETPNVITEDLISGIDFRSWYLSVGNEGERMVGNSRNQDEIMLQLVASDSQKLYRKLCQKLKKLMRRPYLVKYLSKKFDLNLEVANNETEDIFIRKAFHIQSASQNYLLLNLGCKSQLFKWRSSKEDYELLENLKTGQINQLGVVKNGSSEKEEVKIMTNGLNHDLVDCPVSGLNLWQINENRMQHLHYFDEKVLALTSSCGHDKVYAITQSGPKMFSTRPPYNVSHWNITESLNSVNFSSFQHIYDIFLQRMPVRSLERPTRSVLTYMPRSVQTLNTPDESLLKLNETVLKKLAFEDFAQLVEHILEDLNHRLSIEVNITEFSLLDVNFFDGNFVQDFIAIVEELRNQSIFPPNTFESINEESIEIPDNLAQTLAARTAQIVWPVIVEIDEVHRYLKSNDSTDHPICACILNHLGVALQEIMSLAFDNLNSTETVLNDVILRINEFQKDLQSLQIEIKLEIGEDLKAEIDKERMDERDVTLESVRGSQTENFLKETNGIIGDMMEESSNPIPSFNFSNEMSKTASLLNDDDVLYLQVGAEEQPHYLLAVVERKFHKTPGNAGGISLYSDLLRRNLFQFLSSHQARSLVSLRIRDVTLFGYIEGCCTVKVLQYRGVEGFVPFATFSTEVAAKQLVALTLPNSVGCHRYFLATVLRYKLRFYEVEVAGLNSVRESELEIC